MELQEQLEALGSVLKSQIMSDLNSWEDRRRETQSRSSKKAAKRARPAPLPEIPHNTLVELRRVQLELFRDHEAGEKIISWAISVLTVFVSVADMKGNCKLTDLIGLPGTKSVFQLLVLAVESSFSRNEPEHAESAFIDAVLATSKNPRAVTWILHQYGLTHSRQFPRCLHMHAVSQLAHGNASIVGTESTGLNTAISDLAASHPDQNTRALADILHLYRQAVSCSISGESIEENDSRRFVLFYLLHMQSVRLGVGEKESRDEWLGSAIRFEMQTGFSRFLVQRDDVCEARPLAESIQVLYGDHGRAKKVSDQALDIARVLGVFEVINIVICKGNEETKDDEEIRDDEETKDDKEIKDDEDIKHKVEIKPDDVEMEDADSDRMCLAFIDACAQTLRRLIKREQELIVLSQMPRLVKQLPQPVPPGLQEAVQRGGRTYNNGPISLPTLTPEDAKPLCARLFSLIRASSQLATDQSLQLHTLLCDSAPMLVEIMASRMDSIAAAKALVRFVVDDWPMRSTNGPDSRAATALLRSLVAIGELHRGMLLPRLQHITSVRLRGDMDPEHVQHMVDVLSLAVARQTQISSGHGLQTTSEAVDGLCSVLVASWRPLWQRCFSVSLDQGDKLGPGRSWAMRTSLVHALRRMLQTSNHRMQTTDRISLLEHALCELAKIQHAMAHASFEHRSHTDIMGMVELARSLLSLCILQCASADVERIAIERLMQLILARPSITEETTAIRNVFSIDCGACDNMMRTSASSEANVDPRLETMLAGQLMSRLDAARAEDTLQTEHMVWQNAVRPLAKYPRSGLSHSRDRYDDAWAFAKPRMLSNSRCPRILCTAVLVLAQGSHSAADALAQLLEEYYADALLSMPPMLLDARLDGELHVRPEHMELLHDVRRNAGLEHVLFESIKSSTYGARVARHLVSALLVALVVFWNGALGEPAVRRADDVAFTARVVTLVNDAYADDVHVDICPLFEFVTGMELARLLHRCVWRYVLHRMPNAERKAHATVRHVMRQHIVRAAPLFASIYPS
ncbi:hypothetical protein GGH12_005656 [Coemansia sp. RSA 1822]|nr:hypothetical protein LPJ76_005696 [Coemansia sp. RSA 638]KAJ2539037.1 hypothetical protein GGF49_005504 [Coemansia sp. RSA 1853]KAJ2558871.1 hypothetical protein GGH12_005656 [Coemansia sp. RSA 1822]